MYNLCGKAGNYFYFNQFNFEMGNNFNCCLRREDLADDSGSSEMQYERASHNEGIVNINGSNDIKKEGHIEPQFQFIHQWPSSANSSEISKADIIRLNQFRHSMSSEHLNITLVRKGQVSGHF